LIAENLWRDRQERDQPSVQYADPYTAPPAIDAAADQQVVPELEQITDVRYSFDVTIKSSWCAC
jgi:hypothetical protein